MGPNSTAIITMRIHGVRVSVLDSFLHASLVMHTIDSVRGMAWSAVDGSGDSEESGTKTTQTGTT